MRRGAIPFIFCVSIAVRFWNIDAPFDDRWSWRQSDVAAIARNYLENGFHFARPQIDWAGDQPGYVGTEFPLLPFAVALLYMVLGVHEWIGRLVTVVFFGASLPFVFLIVRRAFDESAAILALIFYSFAPLMIAGSRAFMPDVPSLTCALAGWYFFWRWTDEVEPLSRSQSPVSKRTSLREFVSPAWHFAVAALLVALSLLLKPTTATIGAPMAVVAWQKFRWQMFLQPMLWFFAGIALVPSAIWYWHANSIAREFYPHHMFGAGGVSIMSVGWYGRIFALTLANALTPVLSALAVIGFFTPARSRSFRWWLLAMVLFVIIAGYGNRHEWYRLPLVPIAAAFAGAGLSSIARKRHGYSAIAAALILFGLSSLFFTRRYLEPSAQSLCRLGQELRACTSPGALVVTADDGDPIALYYAHRKGWHFLERGGIYDGNPYDNARLIDDLESLRARGATHLTFYQGTIWWLDYYPAFADYLARTATLISASADYRIYELRRE